MSVAKDRLAAVRAARPTPEPSPTAIRDTTIKPKMKRLTVDLFPEEHRRWMQLALENDTKVNPMLRKLMAGMSDAEIAERLAE